MDKAQIRKMLKPLIKECIREMLFEEKGVLSHVIAETLQGAERGLLTEKLVRPQERPKTKREQKSREFETDDEARRRLEEHQERLNQIVGGNVFSGVAPLREDKEAMAEASGDSIDVGALTELVGGRGRWANAMKGKK